MEVTACQNQRSRFSDHILIWGKSDETTLPNSRRFLIQVEPTLESLLSQEDPDGNMQITIEDNGPKVWRGLSCLELK